MDIAEAIAVLDTEVLLTGQGDADLAAEVDRKAKALIKKEASKPVKPPKTRTILTSKAVAAADGLDGGSVMLKPIEALLRLARATMIGDTGDVFDAYLGWGRLRYLGAFDPTGPTGSGFCLSEHADRIGGNQRRVLSEELGIGFGVLLAEAWCKQYSIDIVNPIDVDRAVREGPGWAPLHGADIQLGSRQPDYLLVCQGNGPSGTVQFRALECKGTSNEAYAHDQLARAVTQLDSLTVNGSTPPGLATSIISNRPTMKYLAVDPDDGQRTSYRIGPDNGSRGVNVSTRDSRIDVDGETLAPVATRSIYGALAEYAGNTEAANALRRRYPNEQPQHRPRRRPTVETTLGDFRGYTTSHPTPDGRWLEVFQGVETSIDDALSRNDAEEVAHNQLQFARRTSNDRTPNSNEDPSATAIAAAPEGSILKLTIRNEPRDT